jgi:hypothetical protein
MNPKNKVFFSFLYIELEGVQNIHAQVKRFVDDESQSKTQN